MSAWNNERKTFFRVVTPPSLYFPTHGPTIFLAGSIDGGNARQWQDRLIKYVENAWQETDVTIFNPRRDIKEFTEEMEVEQHAWGISMLEASDYILLHLAGGGGYSPISLLELGMYMNDPKLWLSMDLDYPRRYAIEVHYRFTGKGIFIKPEDAIEDIRKDWLKRS